MRFAIFVLAGAMAPAQTPVQLQTNLFLGEWSLNVEKTETAGNARPPQNGRRTYEDRGDGVVVGRREGTGADGQPFLNYYAVRYDGRDYPYVVLRAQTVGQIAFELPDPASTTWTIKQDSVVTATGTSKVSADGQTLVVTTHSPRAGQSVEVYDRLRAAAGNPAALSTGPAQEARSGGAEV